MAELDKELLEFWSKMEPWEEYLAVRLPAGEEDMPDDEYKRIELKYYYILNWRIQHCKELLKTGKSDLLYYTLAHLYDEYNLDDSQEYLFKRPVRYYAIKAVRENRSHHKAWALLARTYSWVALFADDKSIKPDDVRIEIVPEDNDSQSNQDIKSHLQQRYELSSYQLKKILFVEKAIFCIKQAITIKPRNYNYKYVLRLLYHQRNEEYKPEGIPRNIEGINFNYPGEF